MTSKTSPKIAFYSNVICPASHKIKIALRELGLEWEEIEVDVSKPRSPEFLAINPRGLVPTLVYEGHALRESVTIATFLAEAHGNGRFAPVPGADVVEGALWRQRVAFFQDTWAKYVHNLYTRSWTRDTDEEGLPLAEKACANVVAQLDPLLADAAPYFGGSGGLTLAEALVGPTLLVFYTHARHGVFPARLVADYERTAPNFHRWATAVMANPAVTRDFREDEYMAGLRAAQAFRRSGASFEGTVLERVEDGTA